jgi:DNA helicase IV
MNAFKNRHQRERVVIIIEVFTDYISAVLPEIELLRTRIS